MRKTASKYAVFFLVFGTSFFFLPQSALATCINTIQANTIAAAATPTPEGETPTVTTLETCGGDDVSYRVPVTATITFDGQQFSTVYATTNSVITFGRPDNTYWTYPGTPSISVESIDWVAYPSIRSDEHLIIQSSDGGFQVDLSARPYANQSVADPTNIVITAAINTDGTVAISYAVAGPTYNGRTGARVNSGQVVTLEQAGVTQVAVAPTLAPTPEPSPSPSETATSTSPAPSPTPSESATVVVVTPSPSPSETASVSASPSPSPSPVPSDGSTAIATPDTSTVSDTSTSTSTPSPSPTPTPTPTPSPTPSPTPTPEPIVTPPPAPAPVPAPAPAPAPEPVRQPEPQPEPQPSPTPVPDPEPTPEPEPQLTPEEMFPDTEPVQEEPPVLIEEPVVTPEPEVVDSVEPTPQPEPTPEPVDQTEPKENPEPTVEPSPIPTSSVTPSPIQEPEPSVAPAPEVVILTEDTNLEELAPDTPVELENGVVLTAEVVLALAVLENPVELLTELFTDPGQVLTALSNIGADMSAEVREKSKKVVVSAIIAGNIATQAAASAAAVSTYRRKP